MKCVVHVCDRLRCQTARPVSHLALQHSSPKRIQFRIKSNFLFFAWNEGTFSYKIDISMLKKCYWTLKAVPWLWMKRQNCEHCQHCTIGWTVDYSVTVIKNNVQILWLFLFFFYFFLFFFIFFHKNFFSSFATCCFCASFSWSQYIGSLFFTIIGFVAVSVTAEVSEKRPLNAKRL